MRGGSATAIAAALKIALMVMVAGCGIKAFQTPAPVVQTNTSDETTSASNSGPRMITSLAQMPEPSGNSATSEQSLLAGAAALHASSSGTEDPQGSVNRNLEHLYLSKTHTSANGGEARGAGDRTLLNAKARQFAEFSDALLNQTLVAAQTLAAQKLQDHKLPEQMKPVILIATMTPAGKLTDLSVEQHSGFGPVDRILIEACKEGLWAMNPPQAALADDGMFRMRFEGVIGNYSYDVQGNYRYVTHVGLALM
ncbi:MAG TPA: hypothetical protein VGG60_17295 [Candidatus Binataceae bacterium]|jgi:hypothetical protein